MRYVKFICDSKKEGKEPRIVIISFPDDMEEDEMAEVFESKCNRYYFGEIATWDAWGEITQEEAENSGIDLVY